MVPDGPYPATSLDKFGGLATVLFGNGYAVIIQPQHEQLGVLGC
jgi:hypothetical protein